MTKILLVEDDKSLREIYGVRLLAEGYDIVSAGDGEEALAMAIKERPRLILSDVMMPKISGFDMLDILRSTTETKDVKVIMMTALSSEDQRKRGEQLGADRYLVKSQVGIEDVVRAVHEVLRDVPGIGTEPKPSAAAEPDNSSQDMSYVENLEVDPNDTPSVERPDVESLSPQPAPEEPPVLPTAESPQAPQTPPEPAVSENTAPVLQPVPQISPQSPIQAAMQQSAQAQADDPAQQQPTPAPTSMPTADPNAAQLTPQPAAPNPSDAAVLTPAAPDPAAAMQQSAQTQADDPAQQQPAPAPTSMPTAPQQ